MSSPVLSLRPHLFGRAVVTISGLTILTALLLTHFNPRRFRIHPYPYLSDAGLHDPERIIINFGLSLSSALFVPLATGLYLSQESYLALLRAADTRSPALFLSLRAGKRPRSLRWIPNSVGCDALPLWGLRTGLMLAFFLALFTCIPGWWYFHHIFALAFALSAAAWCVCHAVFTHARCRTEGEALPHRLPPRLRFMYVLFGIEAGIVLSFGVIWSSVKLQIPFKMIPNKDPRFIMLAFLEYLGTCSFLTFIAMVSNELYRERINLSLLSRQEFKSYRKTGVSEV